MDNIPYSIPFIDYLPIKHADVNVKSGLITPWAVELLGGYHLSYRLRQIVTISYYFGGTLLINQPGDTGGLLIWGWY